MPPIFLGIYDTEQQVHCEFMADAVGVLRCLPRVPEELPDHAQFADASCTTRIFSGSVFASASIIEPVSIPISGGARCAATRHVVGRFAPLPLGAAHYRTDERGACVSSSFDPDEPEVFLADVSAPEQWVAGVETTGILLGGRLRVREVEAPGAARFPIGLFDEHWGEPCSIGGGVQCWPNSTLSLQAYSSDPQCESPVWGTDGCVTPPFVSDGGSFFTLKPYLGPLFQGGGLGCFPWGTGSTDDPGRAYFSRAAQVTDPDLAPSPKQAYRGEGRLESLTLEDDQGRPVTVDNATALAGELTFQDRATGHSCVPVWTPSGVRCVPEEIRFSNALSGFADENCVEPAFYCPDATCDGILFVSDFRSVHGLIHADVMYRAKDIGSRYWTRVQGACTAGTLPLVYFSADGEVPWERFPALDELNGGSGGP